MSPWNGGDCETGVVAFRHRRAPDGPGQIENKLSRQLGALQLEKQEAERKQKQLARIAQLRMEIVRFGVTPCA